MKSKIECITSSSNPRVKYVIQLQAKARLRHQHRVFVAEGVKMVREAPRQCLQTVYVSESFAESDKIHLLGDIPYVPVSDKIFAKMSDTVTPQGVLAIVKRREYETGQILTGRKRKGAKCFLMLESLSDPGNLGTIIRTAEGAGITGIFMSRDTVDIYNPKVIRSTMGAVYRVPFLYVDDLAGLSAQMKEMGIILCATHLSGEKSCFELDYRKDTCFLIGNEANGLTEQLAEKADIKMKIPMEGQGESLNAAIAATVCMYEAYRQNL